MIIKLIWHVFSVILALLVAFYLIPGIDFIGSIKILIVVSFIMGLINFLIKPILKIITLPLKFLTLGVSSLIINIGLIWLVIGVFFQEFFIITTWLSYLWILLLIWLLNMLLISKK